MTIWCGWLHVVGEVLYIFILYYFFYVLIMRLDENMMMELRGWGMCQVFLFWFLPPMCSTPNSMAQKLRRGSLQFCFCALPSSESFEMRGIDNRA